MRTRFNLLLSNLSVLDVLTDAQAGRLFKAIRAYHMDDEESMQKLLYFERKNDSFMKIVFEPFKAQFEDDVRQAAEKSAKRAAAGRTGGLKKKKNEQILTDGKQMLANASNAKQNKQMPHLLANASELSLLSKLNNDNNNNYSLSLSKEEINKEERLKTEDAAHADQPVPVVLADNLPCLLDDCWKQLLAAEEWRELVVYNTRSAGYSDYSPTMLARHIDAFFRKLQNEGIQRKAPADAKAHFANWLKIELANTINPTNQKPNGKNKQPAQQAPATAASTGIRTVKL